MPFLDWVKKPDGESDLSYRQLGFFGDRLLARAEVVVHTPRPFSAAIDMVSLVEIGGPHGLHLLLAEYRLAATTSKRADELRRPGLLAVREHFEAAGFELDSSSNVRSTAISLGLETTDGDHVKDGWLSMPGAVGEHDPSREVYRVLALMVAIERRLIAQAERSVASAKTGWGMHARRRVLRSLPKTPSTDNELIADQFDRIRASLHLDVRREQVLDALEVRVRRVEFGAAFAAAGLAVGLALADFVAGILGNGF